MKSDAWVLMGSDPPDAKNLSGREFKLLYVATHHSGNCHSRPPYAPSTTHPLCRTGKSKEPKTEAHLFRELAALNTVEGASGT